MTKPTVGRIVHFWPGPDQYGNRVEGPLSAMILRVDAVAKANEFWSTVTVKVFTLDGVDAVRKCQLAGSSCPEHRREGHCTWPEREPE